MIIILFLIIHLLISLNESENALANDVTDITCVTYHVNVKMCQQNELKSRYLCQMHQQIHHT